MENTSVQQDSYTIDIMHILKCLWKRAWIIVIAAILAAAIGFGLASFIVTPMYSSSIMVYVNNNSLGASLGISLSDLQVSQSLIDTYNVVLNNRTTLTMIIDTLGLEYDYKELSDMIKAGSVNGTEIMKVTVTGPDHDEAAKIANCIAEVLPVRVSEIMDGAAMEVVDSAIPDNKKISPSITKYTAIGFLLGVFVSCAAIALFAILDDTIHDEDYVIRTYNYPVLAKVPDLTERHKSSRYEYSQHKQSGNQDNRKG